MTLHDQLLAAERRPPHPTRPLVTHDRFPMNFTYKFERLPINPAAPGSKHPQHPSYADVIATHAAQGWRFVQLVVENPASIPAEYVLIFERPI